MRFDRERYEQLAGILNAPAGLVDDVVQAARRQLLAGQAGEAADAAQHVLRAVVFEAITELVTDAPSSDLVLALYGVLDAHLLRDL